MRIDARRAWLGIYPGWWLAIGTSLSLGMAAGMTFWAFGLFVTPWQHEFGWSGSLIAAGVSVTSLVSGCASPLVGRLVDRYQPRVIIGIGTAATAVVYLLFLRVSSLWQLLVLMAALGFFRTWIFYIPFTTIITRWFSRRRAAAMGIATSGFGLGGVLFLPLMAEVIDRIGWRGAFALAALLLVVINGALVLMMRNDPPVRWRDWDAAPVQLGSRAQQGILPADRVRSVLRGTPFWVMSAGFSLFFFAQWAFLFHGPQFFERHGWSSTNAALILSCAAGLGVVLRFTSGWLIDRIRRLEVLAAIVMTTMAIALSSLMFGVTVASVTVFVLLWGIGSGIGPGLEPLLVSHVFGRKHYATLYGFMDGADTVVSIPGPWFGSLILASSSSYVPVLGLYGGVFLMAGGGFLWLARTLRSQSPSLSTHSGSSMAA